MPDGLQDVSKEATETLRIDDNRRLRIDVKHGKMKVFDSVSQEVKLKPTVQVSICVLPDPKEDMVQFLRKFKEHAAVLPQEEAAQIRDRGLEIIGFSGGTETVEAGTKKVGRPGESQEPLLDFMNAVQATLKNKSIPMLSLDNYSALDTFVAEHIPEKVLAQGILFCGRDR